MLLNTLPRCIKKLETPYTYTLPIAFKPRAFSEQCLKRNDERRSRHNKLHNNKLQNKWNWFHIRTGRLAVETKTQCAQFLKKSLLLCSVRT